MAEIEWGDRKITPDCQRGPLNPLGFRHQVRRAL
jgi:hypothetical protein